MKRDSIRGQVIGISVSEEKESFGWNVPSGILLHGMGKSTLAVE